MKRDLGNWLESYIEYTKYSEAPEKFHFWTGVSVIAGALQGKVQISQGYFRWPANFYIVFVAPPGIVQKSTTINIGIELLSKVPGVFIGPDVVTWQALAQNFALATVGTPLPDGTFWPHASMTLGSSEFGNLLNPSDREMVDFLVHMWDGQRKTFRKVTKMSGTDVIENPWLNVIACTTPAWITANFPHYLIGGGFSSRSIFIYAEQKRALVAYPGEIIPKGHQERAQSLIHDLEIISKMVGDFTLTTQARAWGEVWYTDHYENFIKQAPNEFMAGYFARKQTHLHKLAMILSAATRDDQVIDAAEMEQAQKLLAEIELDMPKVFERIGMTREGILMVQIKEYLLRAGESSMASVAKEIGGKTSMDEFMNALKFLQLSGEVLVKNNAFGAFLILQKEDSGLRLVTEKTA